MSGFRDDWERRVIPTLERNGNIQFEMRAADAVYLRRTALKVADEHSDREGRLLWRRIAAQIEIGFGYIDHGIGEE